jgi:hypothetical protein
MIFKGFASTFSRCSVRENFCPSMIFERDTMLVQGNHGFVTIVTIGMVRIPSVKDYIQSNNFFFHEIKLDYSKQLWRLFFGWCGWKRTKIVFEVEPSLKFTTFHLNPLWKTAQPHFHPNNSLQTQIIIV